MSTTTFGQGVSGDTQATVASGLANAIQSDPARIVNATVTGTGGNIVQLVAVTTGAAGNNVTVTTGWTWDTVDFSTQGASFTAAASSGTLQNGIDSYNGATVYDAGNVTVTIGTQPPFVASAPYGNTPGNSTSALVAAAIVGTGSTGLNRPGSPVTATASGTTITITYAAAGTAGDAITITSGSQSTQTQWTFSGASFNGSNGLLGNGMNAGDVNNQPLVTLYQYDALGNLLCVEQHGNISGTGCSSPPASDATSPWRVRRFTYDSLSRLLTAHNPESGTITYSYDADGNLLQKTSPAPNQTGSATQTISYCYDELHRVTGKVYSAQSCPFTLPTVSYTYDSGSFAKGKLTSLTDQAGSATYSYDNIGRMTSETRVISGVSKQISYEYNLDGSLSKLHYPSGRVITYTPDSAGRTIAAADSNGTTYVWAEFYANGAEFKRHQPVIFFQTTLNSRLQPAAIYSNNGLPGPAFINKTYVYGAPQQNNGNIISIVANEDATRTQTFTYDALNRITSGYSAGATGAYSWGETYAIDPWGNLNIAPMGNKAHGGTFANASDNNNRPLGFTYDAAGNLTNTSQYVYDPENRIQITAGTAYTYDADGQRVLKSNTSGTPTKRYWMSGGDILAEGDGSGNLTAEYVFFGRKRLVRIDLPSNTVHYYLSDHLGSTSKVVNSAGAVEEESDFTAFGSELTAAQGMNHYKFTGKERDTETQLDYFGARYYSSLAGRFITPDWAAKAAAEPYANFGDPQTLNRYG